jgi:dienelactone hydrolase
MLRNVAILWLAILCASLSGNLTCSVAQQANAENVPEQYREPFAKSWPIREKQHLQMKAYLDGLTRREANIEAVELELDFSDPAAYEKSLVPIRQQLQRVKGLPPPHAISDPKPRFELVARDKHAEIYRVWTELFRGVEAYAIYMVPRQLVGKAPVIVAVHGGSGCPEAVCDFDTRVNYTSFGPQAVRRGYIVYAPGLLMNVSYADPPDPRLPDADWQSLGKQAARVGLSTADLQAYQIIEGTRAVIKARPEADGERIGMTGLSMGGGYTVSTTALWPEIKAAAPSAGFRGGPSDASDDHGAKFRVATDMPRGAMIALICPRPLMIQSGEQDTVAPLEGARRGFPAARRYYEKLKIADRIELNVHPGGHVFENEAIFRFFDKHLR